MGIESEAEFVDITLNGQIEGGEIVKRLGRRLPQGMEVVETSLLPEGSLSIEAGQRASHYEVSWEKGPDLAEVKRRFENAMEIVVKRARGEKATEVNLKDYVDELAVFGGNVLGIAIRNIRPALKISETLSALPGVCEGELKNLRIKKIGVDWKE